MFHIQRFIQYMSSVIKTFIHDETGGFIRDESGFIMVGALGSAGATSVTSRVGRGLLRSDKSLSLYKWH